MESRGVINASETVRNLRNERQMKSDRGRKCLWKSTAAKEGVAARSGKLPEAGPQNRRGFWGPEWEPHLAGEMSSTPDPSVLCQGRQ